jgi:hypothetical protein
MGYAEENIANLEHMLPQEIFNILETTTSIANLNLPTEEKVELLAETLQRDCTSIAVLWITFEVIGYFLPVSLISNILFWLTVSCFLVA